eukprot:c17096_g1_i1 orf=173-1003(-)
MLRVLRRHVGVRVPPPLLSSFCRAASDCDAAHDSQCLSAHRPGLGASLADIMNATGSKSNLANIKGFLPQWIGRPLSNTNAPFASSRFKAYWMANVSFQPKAAFSSAAKKEETAFETESASSPSPKTLEDFQHEEIVGPTVERDMSPVADELRKAHLEMREAIQKFTKALLAVGAVHLVWGGMMFRVLDSPFSHALMTQVCASALVLFGLAYYSKQALKPIEFFTRLEERSRLRILTLSLQVTKTMSSFFQRGYGVGLVLFLALTANLLGCLKFLF